MARKVNKKAATSAIPKKTGSGSRNKKRHAVRAAHLLAGPENPTNEVLRIMAICQRVQLALL